MSARPFAFVTRTGSVVRAEILDRYALKQDGDSAEESKQILDPFEGTYGELNLVIPPYAPLALARLLDQNTYHARACRVKARDTAGLGWTLAADDDANEEKRAQLVEQLENLGEPLQTTLTQAQFDYEAIGWATIEVIRERGSFDGPVVKLVHVPAHEIRIRRRRDAFVQVVGNRKVWFRPAGATWEIDARTGQRARRNSLDPKRRGNELIYWRNYWPHSRYYGVPDVITALGAILGDVSRRDFNIAFFANHGVPAWAVFVSGDFDPGPENADGKTELEATIEEQFREFADNPHSVLTMMVPTREGEAEGKIELRFERLSTEVKDASFTVYRKDNRDEILSAHGVDPYRVAAIETGTLGQNVAEQSIEIYKASTLEPRQFDIEELFNKHVLSTLEPRGWRWKLANIDTSDAEADLEMLERLHGLGAVSAREVRGHFAERFGLDADAPIPEEERPDFGAVEAGLKALSDRLAAIAKGDLVGNGRSELAAAEAAALAAKLGA